MRSLWKRHPREERGTHYISVLDLGTSSVKALVLERDGNQVTILGRGRGSVRPDEPTQGDASLLCPIAADGTFLDAEALAAACDEALCQAEDATEATVGQKIVPDLALFAVPTACLRGALGAGSAERIALETGIVADECNEVVARAGRRALRNLGRVTGPGSWQLLDAMLVTFSIDGHRVTDPVGFRGHLFEAVVSVVAAPPKLFISLQQLADALQLEPPGLVAEPLALAAASPGEGLIVEVGARATELCLARCGAPVAFGSVPYGGATLTQALADTFELALPRAEALKRAYGAGLLTDDGALAVREALQKPLDTWLSSIVEHLKPWNKIVQPWPPDIYLCGGASLLGDIQERAAEARWLDTLPFPHTPRTHVWDGSNLSQVLDRTSPRWQIEDIVALSLAAWSIRERGPATPDGMLRISLGMD